ncbi:MULTISPECIES: type VII secretion target [Cellulomonas]|uniref:type VII secretion target n=1 Tax=Cellulomonas TaxID=1707 RepID=UPI0010A754EF|nr:MULTISPECIES: type VII secretion target [Cellulomonas]
MSDRYEVQPYVLSRSAQEWRDQAARVRTAADRLADAPTGGFGPRVASAAASWTATWGGTVRSVATTGDTIAEELLAAAMSYGAADLDAQQRFDTWLDGAP